MGELVKASCSIDQSLVFDEEGEPRFKGPFALIGVYLGVYSFLWLELVIDSEMDLDDLCESIALTQERAKFGGNANHESFWQAVERAAPKDYRPMEVRIGLLNEGDQKLALSLA